MRRRCNDPHRQVAETGRRRLPCVSRPNAIVRFATGFVVFWLSLTWQISQPRAQIVSSPRELAIIRINVLDLLVHASCARYRGVRGGPGHARRPLSAPQGQHPSVPVCGFPVNDAIFCLPTWQDMNAAATVAAPALLHQSWRTAVRSG